MSSEPRKTPDSRSHVGSFVMLKRLRPSRITDGGAVAVLHSSAKKGEQMQRIAKAIKKIVAQQEKARRAS